MNQIHPTKEEEEFLKIGYNRFLDVYEEIMSESFWHRKPTARLYVIKDAFSIYSELLQYEPLKLILKNNLRPDYQTVGKDLMKFIRNILLHFPFYTEWSDVIFNKSLILTFDTSNSSIDKFLSGSKELKYRFWDAKVKKMTYIVIDVPDKYQAGDSIYLKDVVSEKDGVKFCLIFMHSVLMSQVESIKRH